MSADTFAYAGRMAMREARRFLGRLATIALCVGVGVASFTTIYGFSEALLASVHTQSRKLLGADLVVTSRRVLEPAVAAALTNDRDVTGSTTMIELQTLGTRRGHTNGTATRMLVVRAIDGSYPLRGALTLASGQPVREALRGGVVVEASLARTWGLHVARGPDRGTVEDDASVILLAGRAVPITGIVERDDAQQARAFVLGPRVYISPALAHELGLLSSRAQLTSHLLLAVSPGKEREVETRLRARSRHVTPRVTLSRHDDAAFVIAQPIRNLTGFLRQMAMLTLLLSLVSASSMTSAFLETRREDAAILRTLGAPPLLAARTYGLLVTTLLLLGTGICLACGRIFASHLPHSLDALMPPVAQDAPRFALPVVDTLLACLVLALAVAPMLAAVDTSPHVAHRAAGPRSVMRERAFALTGLAAGLLVAVLVVRSAPSVPVGLGTFAVVLVLVGLQAISVRLGLRAFARRAASLPLALRLAAAQLAARPAATTWVMCAIGTSIFLLITTQIVKNDLVAPLLDAEGSSRPNVFVHDIAPDQIEAVRALSRRVVHAPLEDAPVVQVRIVSVAGRPMETAPGAIGTKEQPATFRSRLGRAEQVAEGQFWPALHARRNEVSLERGFARDIDASLGDEIVFDVLGEEVRAYVTSIRRVSWLSLAPSFTIVLHPSLVSRVPFVYFASLEAPDEAARERFAAELARTMPNVALIDLADFAEKARQVLGLITRVAEALASAIAVCAFLVLGASLIASRFERARELALLRCVGASDALLTRSLVLELALLGVVPAVAATLLGLSGAALYARAVLGFSGAPRPGLALALLGVSMLCTLAVGLVTLARVLREPPLTILRDD